MRAAVCSELGEPSVLRIEDIPEPVAGTGEVVIRVHAAGLNFFDILLVAGRYQVKPPLPFSPGAEVAGIIETVGDGVETFRPGDRVATVFRFGACREKVVARIERIVPLPDDVPDEIGAALLVTYPTALHALRDRGGLQAGETIAVLGAAGGVGQAGVEIGKILGARVIACAGSEDKLKFAQACGADATVNYAKENLESRLKTLTAGAGVDLVLDLVGGSYSEAALRATGWRGRHLVVGFASGAIPRVPLNLVLLKNIDIRGVMWGEARVGEPPLSPVAFAGLVDWYRKRQIRPHIDAVYPLEQTAVALQAIADRTVKGKVLVRP